MQLKTSQGRINKRKRQNQLTGDHIAKIIKTYQFSEQEARYSRKVEMAEIEKKRFQPEYLALHQHGGG